MSNVDKYILLSELLTKAFFSTFFPLYLQTREMLKNSDLGVFFIYTSPLDKKWVFLILEVVIATLMLQNGNIYYSWQNEGNSRYLDKYLLKNRLRISLKSVLLCLTATKWKLAELRFWNKHAEQQFEQQYKRKIVPLPSTSVFKLQL